MNPLFASSLRPISSTTQAYLARDRQATHSSTPLKSGGFTVLELLTAVAIAGILVAVGLPTLRDTLASRRVSASVSTLASSIRIARSEAIKRGIEVSVCRGTVVSGTPTCVNDTDWSVGWLVFADRAPLGAFGAGDVLIRVEDAPALAGGITSTPGTPVTFLRTGVANGAQRNVLFRPQISTSSSSYANLSRRVCVGSTGSTRLIEGDTAC